MKPIKGIKTVSRQFRAPCYQVNLPLLGGTCYIGRFDTLEEAGRHYDAAKHLFFAVTGQADRLAQSNWFNDAQFAFSLNRKTAEGLLGPKIAKSVEVLAQRWLDRKASGQPTKTVAVTREELLERVAILEARLDQITARLSLRETNTTTTASL